MNYKLSPLDIMRKYTLYLLASLAIVLFLTSFMSCSGEVKAHLGEEFSLHIGESIGMAGEDLSIKFLEVTEDSRCPTGVVCIWEGRVSGLVEITYQESLHRVELTEPGLTSWPPENPFKEYKIAYHVEPYPQAGTEIAAEDYRLFLRISK